MQRSSEAGWRIFDPQTRTYFVGPPEKGTAPRFGGSRKTAHVFRTALEAVSFMVHGSFTGCCIELPDGKLHSEVPRSAVLRAQLEGAE